jgi:hypothetical protein
LRPALPAPTCGACAARATLDVDLESSMAAWFFLERLLALG